MVLSRFRSLLLAGAALAIAAPAAGAKTLVYCSEGSPENFSPMINTTGTTFAANRPIYNRLIQFKDGTTELEPALAESWETSPDGTVFTLHLRHGVKWHSNATFKPTRDFNADDVLFTFDRQSKEDNPYHKVSGGSYDYWGDMGLQKLIKSIEKVDPLHGQDHAYRAERAVPGRPRDGFRGDRIRPSTRMSCSRRASPSRSTRSRSAPARSRSSPTSATPRCAIAGSTSIGAPRPSSTRWSTPSTRTRPCAWPSCAPMNAR